MGLRGYVMPWRPFLSPIIEWVALFGYGLLLYLIAPRAENHRMFLWARSRRGPPSAALLTASVLVTWIFAKSITNAANLGENYEILRAIAYPASYLSVPLAR